MASSCIDTDHFSTDESGRIQVHLPNEEFDEDGNLVARYSCGLEARVGGDGLSARVATWDVDDDCAARCDQDTHATPIYCSPNTGQLQGPPRTRTAVINRVETQTEDQSILTGGQDCVGFTEDLNLGTAENPWCVNGVGTVNVGGMFRVLLSAGDNVAVRLGYALDGSAFDFETMYVENGARAGVVQRSVYRPITFSNLEAGQHRLQVRICVDNNSQGNANPAITLQTLRAEVHGMVMSRQYKP